MLLIIIALNTKIIAYRIVSPKIMALNANLMDNVVLLKQ